MEKKICTKCKIEKDLSEFKFRVDNKSKRRSQCSQCDREYSKVRRQKPEVKEKEKERSKKYREENKDKISADFKRWNEANRENRKEYAKTWREQKKLDPSWVEQEKKKSRERNKRYSDSNPEAIKQSRDKYKEANREKINAQSREYYQKNREAILEKKREYEQTEEAKIKRRIIRLNYIARKKGASGDYTKNDFLSLFEEGDQSCYLCGCSINKFDFHIEHKTPLTRGGSNEIDNIGISCMTCNIRKGDRTEEEFREYLINNPYKVPEYRPKAAGQHHGNAKLTLEEVLNLRQEFIVGVHTCRLWAEFYNVSERVISKIITGKSWMLPEAIPDGWKPIDKLPKNGNWSKKTSK